MSKTTKQIKADALGARVKSLSPEERRQLAEALRARGREDLARQVDTSSK